MPFFTAEHARLALVGRGLDLREFVSLLQVSPELIRLYGAANIVPIKDGEEYPYRLVLNVVPQFITIFMRDSKLTPEGRERIRDLLEAQLAIMMLERG